MPEPFHPVPIPPTGPAPAPPGLRPDRAPSEPEAAPPAADLPPAGPDEVALLIDGRPAVVKKGTTVLEAAAQVGLIIPHYCYHPGLSVAGNCRMCLVEIEKMPKLQIGCATSAAQGMIVRTRTERVRATRTGIQEFLLINHPLDCPICDQAGECRLQQYEADYGKGYSRFDEEKVHFPKRYAIGRNVMFDAERCIKCTRCIRFCDEISRTGELTLLERGDHTIVGTFPGRPLDNLYSGNTVDICPVGALTWKPFRFKARVWFLRNVPSVCAGCARGCNVDLAEYRNRIHRMTPRVNMDVNRYWMCDEGRMSHAALDDRPRFEGPLLRAACATGPLQPAAWEEALDRAADLLREVADGSGRNALAGIVSARLSVEDLYMAKKVLGEAIGIPRLAVPPHESGEDDDLLIRRDRTPNARGAALIGLGAPDVRRVREILQDAASGRVRGLVVVGEDIMEAGIVAAEALDRLQALVVIDWWKSPTVDLAHVALPACGYGEFDGTLVNFEGRAQRARAAVRPRGEAEPVWRVLRDLGRRFGLGGEYATASGVFDEAAAVLPPIAGLSYRVLGSLGALVKGA
ncbi:MAG: molybdopterin-dependent oxidoreductase [Acidobacteria bacterium]|nr:molybdopterin-dependent oxidoreductase [Acidobacteriota bacterium]